LAVVKADTIHALLLLHQITHNLVDTNLFVCEYRSSIQSTNVFTKNVKFSIQMEPAKEYDCDNGGIFVKFKMISGNTRRFRKIVQVLYTQISQGPTQQYMRDLVSHGNGMKYRANLGTIFGNFL